MVHEIYERVLRLRYMNYSRQSLLEALSVAKRLPPPDELTTEVLVDFLQQYDNVNTRSYYYYILKVICKEIQRPELIEPIPRPIEVSTVKRRDLLTPKEIAALLRACKDLYERALVEVLVESGCRIGSILTRFCSAGSGTEPRIPIFCLSKHRSNQAFLLVSHSFSS